MRNPVGLNVLLHNKPYKVLERLEGGALRLWSKETGAEVPLTKAGFDQALFEGNLALLGDEPQLDYAKKRAFLANVEDVSTLSEKSKVQYRRRHAYVAEVRKRRLPVLTKTSLEPVIQDVAKAIADRKPPSWTSLYRWVKAYRAREDGRDLVPGYCLRGNREQLDPRAEPIIRAVLKEGYLSDKRYSVIWVRDEVARRIKQENARCAPDDRIRPPGRSALYRVVQKLDRYEVLKARYGKQYADRMAHQSMDGERTVRPLERVEIDHTKLDLFVVDDKTGMPAGRPWLTTVLDVHTKMPLGFCISFTPPSYATVAKALRHAMLPKRYVRKLFKKVKHEWDAYGVMEFAAVDNGAEFHSQSLEDALLQLGVVLQFSPRKMPWYKGLVERWFGDVNRQLLHKVDGTTFSNFIERGEYDPEKNAVVPFGVLEEIVHIWIVDVYSRGEHKGLGPKELWGVPDLPYRVWEQATVDLPPRLPPSAKQLDILLGAVAERKLRTEGIEFVGLFYNDESLGPLRLNIPKGQKVTFKYDPDDLGAIEVLDPVRNRYVTVRCKTFDYASGLSLWQHRIVRKYAWKLCQRADYAALGEAKHRIQELVDEAWRTKKSVRGRQRMSRWDGVAQPTYDQDVEFIEAPVDEAEPEDAALLAGEPPVAPGSPGDAGASAPGTGSGQVVAVVAGKPTKSTRKGRATGKGKGAKGKASKPRGATAPSTPSVPVPSPEGANERPDPKETAEPPASSQPVKPSWSYGLPKRSES